MKSSKKFRWKVGFSSNYMVLVFKRSFFFTQKKILSKNHNYHEPNHFSHRSTESSTIFICRWLEFQFHEKKKPILLFYKKTMKFSWNYGKSMTVAQKSVTIQIVVSKSKKEKQNISNLSKKYFSKDLHILCACYSGFFILLLLLRILWLCLFLLFQTNRSS